MSSSDKLSLIPSCSQLNVFEKKVPQLNKKQAFSPPNPSVSIEQIKEMAIHFFTTESIANSSKTQKASSWIKLGTEVALQKIFKSNRDLFNEISSEIDDVIDLKSKKIESSHREAFKMLWSGNKQKLVCDILGTLMLGPTTTMVLLSDFKSEPNRQKKSYLLLRVKISIKTLEQLNISQKEKETWKNKLHNEIDSFSLQPAFQEVIAASEFIAYYLLKTDLYTLNGKALKEVICWDSQDEMLSYIVRDAVKNSLSITSYHHSLDINICHIISGIFAASLDNPKEANNYFSQMFGYIEKLQSKITPSLCSHEKNCLSNEKKYENLFNFIIKHAKNHNARQLAEQALQNKPKQSELADQINLLDLSGCCLKESDLKNSNIELLRELRSLDLSTNCLEHIPDAIEKLRYLRSLTINGNKLKQIPKFISKMPNLNYLSILKNPIKEVPASLKKIIWELPYLASWV
ncbi:leucine-rich repeat domain-containing protein [Candidatus Neptunochlamydia vexilliferae]|uniref:Disease resistance R13L4/SHOC-2-like LRR domain-containing protein n=1 Tax=Candidatus Neptunichlamydia vexilliferae TaxID=1651774 RepID=A0ABS0AZH5_9BACT|nr:leucine-rich repeat domain-containing protein [Candidatus Neptunochlamydia vexilliferae]MBF5059543.1 hypothetical protein [Candidatus Neptunochlamydia vexilliferae]